MAESLEEQRFRSRPGALGPVAKGSVHDVSRTKCYDNNFDYTSHVNSWLYRTPYFAQSEHYNEQRYEEGRSSIWECSRSICFQHGVLKSYGWGSSKREARNRADHGVLEKATGGFKKKNIDIIKNIFEHKPVVQADSEVSKESNQGVTEQESTKDSNTIITRDEGITVTQDTDMCPIAEYLSAEKVFQFPDLVGRWMPLEALEVKTEQSISTMIATYYLPEDLFKKAKCAPNLVPFEAFIYSQLDIEIRFVVNAQRFQCGKVIASVKFDSYQADAMQNTAMAALNRPHIILDLASNNQGVLKIPFRYHRGFVRNLKNDNNSKGVRPSKFASVYVQYLSPLRTGVDGTTNMFITPYYRIRESKFAAMSYRVEVQMDLAQDVINTAYKSSGLKQVLTRFENMALQFGSNDNRDKPIDYETKIFIPRPRMNFGTGKGLSDAQPLRNNPLALTSNKWIYPYDDEPQSTTQIARIWGLRDSFQWKADNAPGTELWKSVVDPTSRSYTTEYVGTPTPVEYVCGMYNFWTGSLEYRLDFVSNAFHTGAVMITIEFGRPVVLNADACSKASTYTKTFHLGDQKSVVVTVPYIYDTPLRRSTSTAFNPNFTATGTDVATDQTKYKAIGIRPESKTLIRVSVINDLRPIATTTQTIDVLVFMRAGPSFVPHSLKQMSYVLTRESADKDPFIDSFPRDGYLVGNDKRRRRTLRHPRDITRALEEDGETPTTKKIIEVSHKFLPEDVSNEWNEYRQDKIPIPRVQADLGEKEDEDPTADFNSGRVLLKLQTSDLQTSIKDILRRPVLMVYRHTVHSNLTKGENFFLPIMPPSREMNWHQSQAIEFSNLVGQTPQASIMNLYRFWRGGSRYTIFIHSGGAEPLYVTYVPHTGSRIIGNQVIGNDLSAGQERPIMGCGLTTEPILPIVNSSAVVEVPYDTENLWTLTFEEDTQRNYAWRDKGDTNAGHLVLTATTDTQVSIWWSAGDDFEVANFYGIPDCRNRDMLYQWSDAHARVQADEDFQNVEGRTFSSTLQQIKNEMTKLADPKILVKAAIGSIPFVGPATAAAPVVIAVEKLAKESDKTMVSLGKTLTTVDGAAVALTQVTNQLAPLISTINSIFSANSSVNGSVQIWSERLIDFITDLSMAWYQKSWVQVGITCLKMIAKILLVQVTVISEYISSFVSAIQSLVGAAQTQAPSVTSTLIGALAGIVGLALGVAIKQERYASYTVALSQAFFQTSGISYINQVIRFVQTIFDVLKEMVMEALGYKSPEAVALRMLSGKDLLLKNFIASAQGVINEANSNMVLHPRFRTKFWYTVTQAYQIQQVLSMVPANIISPQLSKLCSEVIKVGNERMMDLSCSPVRYEPFVICIEGSHGIGKSYLTDKLVSQLLLAVGFTRCSSGWTYTRAPGSKFWSGYRDQPAIVYDDWLNLNDSQLMSQQISELYQLKSTSTFIPEMAHLEEKRIKANPMLVILLSNGAFPSGMSNVAHHPNAVYRRRDVVLHAAVKQEYAGIPPRELSAEESETIAHLEFQKYHSSTDSRSLSETKRSWGETITWLSETFQHYHAQEEINVRSRVQVLREQLQVDAAESFDFEDPFSLLYKSTEFISRPEFSTNAWLPSEQLEAAVMEIVEQVQTRKLQNVPIIVPPSPEDIFTQFDCCPASWKELAFWFMKGATMTPEVWNAVLKWTAEGISTAMDTITDWAYQPFVGECCVCNEEKNLAYACVQSENQHKVCASCWTNIQQLSPSVCCPICRAHDMALYLRPADGLIATMLIWCSRLTANCVLPGISILLKVLARWKSRAMAKVQFIGEVLVGLASPQGIDTRGLAQNLGRVVTSEIVEPSESFYDAIADIGDTLENRPMASMYSAVVVPAMRHNAHNIQHIEQGHHFYHQRTPLVQMDDWEMPRARDVAASRSQDPIGLCALNPVGFAACRTPKISRLPQCYHDLLKDNVDTILYRDSQLIGPAWQLPIEINGDLQVVMVLDNPCQYNCVWEDENVHREFCELYINRHQALIARAQIQYVGSLQSNPVEFLKTIPRFARPSWAVEHNTIPPDMNADNWWTYLSDTWKNYKDILMVTGLIAGTMGAVYMTYNQISQWFVGSTVTPVPPRIDYWPGMQSDPNYNPEHARFIQRTSRNIRAVRQPRIQGGDNLNDVVEGYICNNYVRIILETETSARYLTAIGLYNHYAVLPRHYVRLIESAKSEGKKIYLAVAKMEWAGSRFTRQEYIFDKKDFIISPVSDVAFFKLPVSFKMFKDIRKFLCTQKDLNNYISSEGKIILAPTRDNQIPQVVPIMIRGYQHSEIFRDADDTHFEAFHVLNYAYSKQGACGSLVCLENSQRPIIAMHCAGQGEGIYGNGFGVLLTQESIEDLLPYNVSVQCEEVDHGSLEEAKFVFDEECQVEYLGTVPPNLQPHIPQKTKIEKSLLHNQYGFTSLTEPTILSPRDARYVHEFSPLYYGARKHGIKTRDFTTTQVERAQSALWDRWLSRMKPIVVGPQRLSVEEAVVGFVGNKYYEALSLNTSAGYPWNLGAKTTKEEWINVDWETRECILDQKLLQEIHRKESLRREGVVPETIFVDTLKDERKRSDKIRKAGATRVFCASPVDYTIALRQNYLHFCAAFMKHRHEMMHGVGIDVHGEEWARLWSRLTKHGTKFIALDYSNFGPAFNARIAKAASDLMKQWTLKYVEGVDEIELDAINWECDHSVHLCGNTIYRQFCGSPSGASITVIKNSLVNLLYVLCAWDALCAPLARKSNIDIWQEFEENVELCVYGDDLIMTVSEAYIDIFNMVTIQTWFSKFGIVSTDASKQEGSVKPWVGKEDVTFLKRGWRKHPTRYGQYLAPLDIVSVNDITQWIWRSPDRRMATRVNCESALLEAHGFGPDMYERLRLKINEALAKLNITPISLTWYDVDHKYFEEESSELVLYDWGGSI